MSPIENGERITCPHCGASTLRRLSFCTICRARLRSSEADESESEPPAQAGPLPAEPAAGPSPARARPSYTLASLALLTALIGVFLGLTVRSFAYGIIFAFLCIPALVRTIRINRRRKTKGHRMAFSEKILAFGASLGVVVVVAAASGGTLAGIIALAAGGGLRDEAAAFALMVFAVLAAGLVGLFLLRWLWPPRDGW
jgi:hypothetical protein